MFRKTILLLFCLISIQFLLSCLSCPDSEYYDLSYQEVIVNEISKNSEPEQGFLLSFLFEENMARALNSQQLSGYSRAYATQECEVRNYQTSEEIIKVELSLVEVGKEEIQANELFHTLDWQNKKVLFSNFLEELKLYNNRDEYHQEYPINALELYSVNRENLPDAYQLKVVLTLGNARKLSSITEIIDNQN